MKCERHAGVLGDGFSERGKSQHKGLQSVTTLVCQRVKDRGRISMGSSTMERERLLAQTELSIDGRR